MSHSQFLPSAPALESSNDPSETKPNTDHARVFSEEFVTHQRDKLLLSLANAMPNIKDHLTRNVIDPIIADLSDLMVDRENGKISSKMHLSNKTHRSNSFLQIKYKIESKIESKATYLYNQNNNGLDYDSSPLTKSEPLLLTKTEPPLILQAA